MNTLGLLLRIKVHAANIQDRDGAKLVLKGTRKLFPRLALIWVDGGYAGKLLDWVKRYLEWTMEVVKRTDDLRGFLVLPKRWIVERTSGWFGRYRRTSKDYEEREASSESIILDILVTHLEPQEIPTTHIQVIDETGVNIADLTFSPAELHKLLGKVTEETIPIPSKGEWPETMFSRIIEYRVNPLFEKAMRKLFDDLPNNEDEWAAGIKKAQAEIAKYITL